MSIHQKWSTILTMIVASGLALLGCSTSLFNAGNTNLDRGQLLQKITKIEERLQKNSGNAKTRFKLAELLFQAGDFTRSEQIIAPLIKSAKPTNKALFLMARLAYLRGGYAQAETLLKQLRENNPKNNQIQQDAQISLMYVYYQTNQYEKTLKLFKGTEGKGYLPLLDLMKSFQLVKPYQMIWPQGARRTEVAFEITDPLPIIPVEVQGKLIHMLIDTGGDVLIVDTQIADGLGIKTVATAQGTFGGEKKGTMGYGKADSIKLGDLRIKQVPVMILPTQRFSSGFAGGKYTIGGVVGTGVLRQFLSTVDYPQGRLVLREKTEQSQRQFQEGLNFTGKTVTKMPFVLAEGHMIMARGSLNGKKNLTFFVDSGLASIAAFSAPIQTLKYAEIPIPETKIEKNSVGGGGGNWASGIFEVQTLSLGSLAQSDLKGEYGSRSPKSFWELGFIQDGLISHSFLRQYAWTIDFSAMMMIFVR